ncbi:MAG TPA: DUF512 domain-containing protein [Blastocatellia bacterium]|jgi:putative radical SAM enzyme (TIGR03279 family)|nr:DUF512 domain-containing protein [Blastocatellia bacterium]
MYTELFETLYPINIAKTQKGVVVTSVDAVGLGSEVGIEAGDRIMKVNGRELRDYLDWQYYTGSEDRVRLDILKGSGDSWDVDVDIGEGEVWGLDFEGFSPRQCANDCIFCFCNQNPQGARPSLFFKDEDTRLSFLHGNYTTMSSISKMEMDRIIEQRLSPQFVSVHATDPEVRRYLLGRKRPDDVLAKMRYLGEHGIELHAQIVLCPGINDDEVLKRTICDLSDLHPKLSSVAVVPVVFTKLHNYRHLMTAVSGEFSRDLIGELRPIQRDFLKRLGTRFVFLADEFYLRAGKAIPGRAHYGDYPQIEDGVGMVRRFADESRRMLRRSLGARLSVRGGALDGTVVTGELFYPTLAGLVRQLNELIGSRLKVVSIPNRFFGEEITVAGLLTGGDVLAAEDSLEGKFVIVPQQACLKQGRIFLDDLSVEDLEQKLRKPVTHGGGSIIEMVDRAAEAEQRSS